MRRKRADSTTIGNGGEELKAYDVEAKGSRNHHPVRIELPWATLLVALALALLSRPATAQPSCPISYGATDSAKPNKLYLYFPTADDATFPNFGGLVSPAKAFNVADLTSYTGTAADLRNMVRNVVVDDYCEFNVQVIATTSAPPATFPRRTTIAIGSDQNGTTWGQAQEVDTGDPILIDFARVWAGTYQTSAGGPGGALNGANSTLQRWAFSIGGTAAHEAGHTYGLSHAHGEVVKPGETPLNQHIMPRGALLTGEDRAGFRRHFDDTSFGILAANVGLSIQTIHNWDFTNPNNMDARQLRMEVLSTQASLLLTWPYNGNLSPWINPTVSSSLGTTTFKGTTYNRFRITWSTGQAWAHGAVGTVPPAARFHVGTTFSGVDFNQPDPVIITGVYLLDAGGNPLPLSPRMIGYDAGTLDAADGSFNIRFFNADDPGRRLIITDLMVHEMPRVASIESMVSGAEPATWQGLPVIPWRTRRFAGDPEERTATGGGRGHIVRDEQLIPIARLDQGRHIFQRYDGSDCRSSQPVGPGDALVEPDVASCNPGFNLDLFPSTTVYITATVIDPAARHWDPVQSQFVVGPVESKLFYQIGGIHPDLNRNGTDDAIDIATGTSQDLEGNGVPDEVELGAGPGGGQGWEISPFLGIIWLDNDLPTDDGAVFGVRAGRELANQWGFEGELSVTPTDDNLGDQGNVAVASANLLYHFTHPSQPLRPFLTAGVGAMIYEGFTTDDSSFAFNLGLGLKARIGTTVGLRFDLRDYLTTGAFGVGSSQSWQATGGLIFYIP